MRAARITELTGPSSITAEDLDAPAPPEDGVVIDVRAAGVCFPDVLLSRGEYQMKPDPPFTPGCEVAGVVSAVGPRSRYAVGDRVAAFFAAVSACSSGEARTPEASEEERRSAQACRTGSGIAGNRSL